MIIVPWFAPTRPRHFQSPAVPAAFLLALLVLAAPAAWSGPPTHEARPEDEVRSTRDQVRPGLLPVMKGETRITGTVMDQEKRPLSGIRIKLIVNGMVVHTATTDAVGQYDFKHAINYTGNETVTLWFVDPSLRLTPKALVLAESPNCRTHKLLSPCYARIQFEPLVESKVHLFDRQTRSQLLVDQGCI